MNRSVVLIGVVLICAGFALAAYPIATTGTESLDIEDEVGFLLAPFGLVIVMLGALAQDPSRTTVGGAFGNPDVALERASSRAPPVDQRARRIFNPHEPVDCRYCRTVITADLAQCPRCARARECRGCGRPLGFVINHVTCPSCGRAEALCNCPQLARPSPTVRPNVPSSRRR